MSTPKGYKPRAKIGAFYHDKEGGGKVESCDCGLCKPKEGKRFDPDYGFDLDAVKDVHCTACDKPIGNLEYELIPIFARFGQMSFHHKECPK